MSIVKEYYENQVEMRGPGAWDAEPLVTERVYILRHDDKAPLTQSKISALFNAAAKDFPGLRMGIMDPSAFPLSVIRIEDRLEVTVDGTEPVVKGYRQLPPHTIGARG